MKVWACDVHRAASWSGFAGERRLCPIWVVLDGHADSDCRMVEMQLVPTDARMVSELTAEELIEELDRRERATFPPADQLPTSDEVFGILADDPPQPADV